MSSDSDIISYSHLRSYSENCNSYYVLGLFYSKDKVLIAVCPNNNPSLFSLFDANFFTIVDPSVSKLWKVIFRASSKHYLYPGFDFSYFSYVGVSCLVENESFYPDLLNDDVDSFNHLAQVLREMAEENK